VRSCECTVSQHDHTASRQALSKFCWNHTVQTETHKESSPTDVTRLRRCIDHANLARKCVLLENSACKILSKHGAGSTTASVARRSSHCPQIQHASHTVHVSDLADTHHRVYHHTATQIHAEPRKNSHFCIKELIAGSTNATTSTHRMRVMYTSHVHR
jgi:hypothetical protein